MKSYLQKFFKSKLNIMIVASQTLALLFLCFLSTGKWAYILTLVLEGLFFIFLGCKQFAKNKELDEALEIQSKIKIEKIDMKNRVRYFGFGKKEPFNKNEDIFVLKNGEEIAVCNQWGKENIQNIVKLANSLGYQVAKIIGIKKKIITEE